MAEKRIGDGEVVITMSGREIPKDINVSSLKEAFKQSGQEAPGSSSSVTMNVKPLPLSCPSPETPRVVSSQDKPPKVPSRSDTLTRRRSLTRSIYSKPKSRLVEQSYIADHQENGRDQISANSISRRSFASSFNAASPNNKSTRSNATNPITSKTPSMLSRGTYDENEEIYKKVKLHKEKRNKVNPMTLFELVVFICMLGLLVSCLTVKELTTHVAWGLEPWKWCVLVMVILTGMLITNWFMHLIVFCIEKNFLLRKKVLYFVHGLKKSVQVFIWLVLVMVTWILLFNHGKARRSNTALTFLNYVKWTLVAFVLASFMCLIKTMLLKILASKFNVVTFFDRIQESIFHHYVIQTLSGPPLVEEAERIGREPSTGRLSFTSTTKKDQKKVKDKEIRVIDMGKVYQMKQEKVSAWTMRGLVEAVRTSGLTTISSTLDETTVADKEITSEMEAVAAAYDIFHNVNQSGCSYIDEDDLRRFLIQEEVDLVLPLFECSDTRQIDRKALTEWVVNVYKSRKALAHSLNDTKTAVKQLNKLVTVILIIVNVVIWFLLVGLATTKVLVVMSSQLVALAFVIGSTCKTTFEAIIFVFVMHPFDVGDLCVVDGDQLRVEEMNLLTTVFLKLNNEKVFYPNSVLATKPISNYYRSPEMGDGIEFSIDFTTPVEKIASLKEKLQIYFDENPNHWHPDYTLIVKEIENVNKLKLNLLCLHTINFNNFREKNLRRTALVMELKRIFEELNIKYYLLPQKVHLNKENDSTDHLTKI